VTPPALPPPSPPPEPRLPPSASPASPAWPADLWLADIAADAATSAGAPPPPPQLAATPSERATSSVEVSTELALATALHAYAAEQLQTLNRSSSSFGASSGGVVVSAQANASVPMQIGGVHIDVSSTEALDGDVLVGVVVPLSDVASDAASDADATLASPLVSVSLGSSDAASDRADDGSGPSLPASALGLADTVVIITLPVATPEAGNSSCTDGPNHTCVAGCCVDGACACRLGFTGRRCNEELRCVLARPGEARFDDGAVCATVQTSAGVLTCTCRTLGTIAVLNIKYKPATNSLSFEQIRHVTPIVYTLGDVSTLWPTLAVFSPALAVLAIAVAACADSRTLYVGSASPRLPFWLRPTLFSFHRELLLMALTRSRRFRDRTPRDPSHPCMRGALRRSLASVLGSPYDVRVDGLAWSNGTRVGALVWCHEAQRRAHPPCAACGP
jgi:hypothetical protein